MKLLSEINNSDGSVVTLIVSATGAVSVARYRVMGSVGDKLASDAATAFISING